MLRTRFTELVGCTVPIQLAGMGSLTLSSPRLAPAVANAGGLGLVSVAGLAPELVAKLLDSAREQLSGPGALGANFLMPFVEPEKAQECVGAAAERVRVVDFFWGEPDASLIETVHSKGALADWQVGSREEAIAAENAGCDFIVAQGIAAGGHVRGTVGVLALLNEVLDSVKIPVLAAGGIGTGRSLAAVLAAGADGARVGTRFVAAEESEAHPIYVDALIKAEAKDTVYTEAFSVGWPNAPHRVLRSCVQAAEALEDDIIGERYIPLLDDTREIHRFQIGAATKYTTGAIEAMALWAGESVDGIKKVQPVAEIVREMAGEAEKLLRRWG
jgi:nitronate monooxygenase